MGVRERGGKQDFELDKLVREPPIPGGVRETDSRRCANILYNLALLMKRGNNGAGEGVLADDFIAELFETARCDEYHSLSEVRYAYAKRLGDARTRRIVANDETTTPEQRSADQRAALRVMVHYHHWTFQRIIAGFTFGERFRWYLWDNVSRIGLYFSALGGAAAGIWSIARRTAKVAKNVSSSK